MRPLLLSRRQVLAGSLLIAGCSGKSPDSTDSSRPPTPERSPEPPPYVPSGALDETAFAWGLQTGDADTESVYCSFRSVPAQVEWVLLQANDQQWEEVQRQSVERTEESYQWRITGLQADTAYNLVLFDPSTGNHSRVGRFRTTPLPGVRRILRIGATSCLGGNEPWTNLSFAAQQQFDVFLLLGDTVYADGAVSLEDYREYWRHAHTVEGLRALTASCSMIATWDDHEVGNNWTRDSLADGQYEDALQAYRESLPQGQGSEGQIWRRLSFGDMVEFFVLDCRSDRTESLYLSVEQMDWLKSSLNASTARFKLILNSVPINDYSDMFGDVLSEDRWQGYPAQRDEILGWIRDQAIQGVLWVAGDVHHGMIAHPDAPGEGPGETQWEVAAGPSGSTLNVAAALYQDTTGHYPVLFADWNYTQLTLDPVSGSCRVEFIGDDGGVIASMELAL